MYVYVNIGSCHGHLSRTGPLLRMCVCVCVCVCPRLYVCMYVRIYVFIFVCMYIMYTYHNLSLCKHASCLLNRLVHTHTLMPHVCMFGAYIYGYIHAYACMRTYTYILANTTHIHAYIGTYTHT